MDRYTENYLAAIRSRVRATPKTWDDVMWQIEFETHAGLDSKEFFRRINERCKALGIRTK